MTLQNTRKLFRYVCATALLIGSADVASSQCTVTITANPDTLPCGGGPVTLTASSTGGSTFALDNDFDLGNAGPGWNVSPAGQFNNPRGAAPNNTGTYMWMGNTTAAPRTLQSAPLDVTCGGDICFDLKFSVQGGAAPCEGPDLANEGVYIQYSTNGGTTFTDIFYFQPNTTTNAYTTWQNYCFPIPLAAQTPNTIFQWFQDGSSGTCCDHWGIDNVTISSTACIAQYYYDWLHVPGSPDSASQAANVTQTTTFDLLFTNGIDDTCSTSFTVVVLGLTPSIINPVDELCQFANDGSVTLTPTDGVAPYTFDLTGPSGPLSNTTGTFNNLPPGNYTVTTTDSQGCDITETFIIGPGPTCCLYTPSTTSVGVTCFGGSDGVVTATAQGGGTAPYTYQWMDSMGNPIAGATDTFMTGLAAGTYQVEIIDAINCVQILTVDVITPAEMTMAFQAFDAVCYNYCDGQGIVIPAGGTVAGPYEFIWDGVTSSNAAVSNFCAGQHQLTIVDDNGCSIDTTFDINQPAPFVITNVAMTDALCHGDCNGVLDITAPGAIDFSLDTTMGWQAAGNFPGLCATQYDITVRDAAGCIADTTFDVLEPTPVALVTSNDTSICTGGTAQMFGAASGGVGNFIYNWDNGLGAGAAQSVTTLGTYNVYALDANGCSTDTLPVVIQQSPPLNVLTSLDDEICWGETIDIDAVGSGGNFGPYTYDWDDGAGWTAQGDQQTVMPLVTTTYNVTITDGCGTTPATDQVTITVHQLPDVNASVDVPVACAPHSVTLSNLTSPGLVGNNCTWWLGQGDSIQDCGDIQFTYPIPGCYDVTLQVESPEGCVNDSTFDQLVCVWSVPTPDFVFEPQPTTILDPTIYFTNTTVNAVTYEWDFDGLGTSQDDNPSFRFSDQEPGEYQVCLTAYTENGCMRDTCHTVVIGPSFHLYAPNAFTPDNDGINDFWFVQGRGIDPTEFQLTIFDRWGNVVFSSTDPAEQWDGTMKGQKAPQDVYVWTVKTKDAWMDEKKEYKGHVTLVR